jgi:hypothetical protein
MTTEAENTRNAMLEVLKNTPAQVPAPVVAKSPAEIQKDNADADYEYTRKNLKKLVDAGAAAIEHFKDVAEETGEPRAFEVLATLLKNTGELVRGVMENASIKNNIDKRNEPVKTVGDKETPTFNNATVFIGTTRDLLNKINTEKKTIDVESTEVK